MQALVLAGGEGTRLRPLTYTTPKPVIPLAGRPFLSFMLDWARSHGVDEVVLSLGFKAEAVRRVLGDIYDGMRVRYVVEDEPLGTAGPVRLALDEGVLRDRFLVLNGDVLTDVDLSAEIAQHESTGAKATLALVAVEDTASYGVVPTDSELRVEAFLEKSAEPVPTDRINAGAYVLEREVAEGIAAGRAVSFEREIFPSLVGNGLYGWMAEGYWIDIGTPERYLEATWDLLAGRVASRLPERDETGSLVPDGSLVGGARIGPQSVLGEHCSVSTGTTVERSVLHDRVIVGEDCEIKEAVVAERARLGERVDVSPRAMIGAGAEVGDGASVGEDARVDPGARIEAGGRVEAGATAEAVG